MHYDVLVASKLRFGFSVSNLSEVMGAFPLISMNTVASNKGFLGHFSQAFIVTQPH